MASHPAFVKIPMRKTDTGLFQAKCRWCDFVSPVLGSPVDVVDHVRKHMCHDHVLRSSGGSGRATG